jgi:predicted ATP-grasp superfamily ATP-dependent carboligase
MSDARPRLAIVGASARAAAFSALRGGFEVVAADLFADADLAAVAAVTQLPRFDEGLEAWLRGSRCDAWMYTGALENRPELVARLSQAAPLFGTPAEALAAVRDPLQLAPIVQAAGLGFPSTLASSLLQTPPGSWLAKTYQHAGGAGVWRIGDDASRHRTREARAYYQQYVEGTPAAAVLVVGASGTRLLGVTRQLLRGAPEPWQYCGSVGPIDASASLTKSLVRLGDELQAAGVVGIVGADLVLGDEQDWVVEINPRWSASTEVLERSLGVSAIALHAEACRGDPREERPIDCAPSGFVCHAKQIVFAARDVDVGPAFHAWAMERSAVQQRDYRLADIPRSGERIAANRPVLTALAAGSTCEEAARELEAWVAEVESRLYAGPPSDGD